MGAKLKENKKGLHLLFFGQYITVDMSFGIRRAFT